MFFAPLRTVFTALVAISSIAQALAHSDTGLGASHHLLKRRHGAGSPARRGYRQDAQLLEDYATYHARYVKFDCISEHGSTFFDACCHPVLKGQDPKTTLDPECYQTPPDTCSTDPPLTTSDPGDSGNDGCDGGDGGADDPPPATTTPTKSTGGGKSVQTSTKPPSSTPTSGGGGGGGSTSGGDWNTGGVATYYSQEGTAGACGKKHGDNDLIVAIDIERYGNKDSVSKLCGQKVQIVNLKNSKSVTATIADVCPTCVGKVKKNSIDLSKGTYKAIEEDWGVGQFDIKWKFV